MTRRICLAIAILVTALALSGCSCEHVYAEATCTEPPTCIECGRKEGEPLGHEWIEADCWFPKTCFNCELTEGEPAEHIWTESLGGVTTCAYCGTADLTIDQELVGRWRSDSGGLLELDEYGNVLNCDFRCWTIWPEQPDVIRWEAENGRATFYAEFFEDEPYRIVKSWTDHGELLFEYDEEVLSIGKYNSFSAWYERSDNTPQGSGIVGKWSQIDMPIWSWQFNEDRTGVVNGKYNLSWDIYTSADNEDRLQRTLFDSGTFDYYVMDDLLIVYLDGSSRYYMRVGY